jgi:hypothetical protein
MLFRGQISTSVGFLDVGTSNDKNGELLAVFLSAPLGPLQANIGKFMSLSDGIATAYDPLSLGYEILSTSPISVSLALRGKVPTFNQTLIANIAAIQSSPPRVITQIHSLEIDSLKQGTFINIVILVSALVVGILIFVGLIITGVVLSLKMRKKPKLSKIITEAGNEEPRKSKVPLNSEESSVDQQKTE